MGPLPPPAFHATPATSLAHMYVHAACRMQQQHVHVHVHLHVVLEWGAGLLTKARPPPHSLWKAGLLGFLRGVDARARHDHVKELLFVGLSMGGALAELTAYHVACEFPALRR